MKVFKINISQSQEAYNVHHKITCPVAGHTGYVQMGKIKKGDLIILMAHNTIHSFGIARNDSFIGNISYYERIPQFTMSDLFTLEVDPLDAQSGIHVDTIASLFKGKPLFSKNFCLECYPEDNYNSPRFILFLNRIILGRNDHMETTDNEVA